MKKLFLLKNIFNKDFVVGAVVPVIIFSVLSKFHMEFPGITLS